MPRAKKDGKFLNCYVDKEILEKLEQYCGETGIPKNICSREIIGAISDAVRGFNG